MMTRQTGAVAQRERRKFLQCSSAAAIVLAAPFAARAQTPPGGTLRIIVPYAPGAASDALARIMAQALDDALGIKTIVENRAGGGAQIGTKLVAAAAPDGLTLGFFDAAFVINPALFGAALPYDTLRDFAPVSLMASAPLVLAAHKSVAANSLKELIALAQAQPGKVSFGSAGIGSAPHMAGEQLRLAAGINLNHIAYKGGGPMVTDLLGGHLHLGFTVVPTIADHVRAGTVRAIAVTGAARSPLLPNVPTFAEAGLAAVDALPSFGLAAPSGVAAALIERYSNAASNAVRAEAMRARLTGMGFVPVGSSAAEFRTRIEHDIAKWSAVVKAGNIKPES